MKRVGPETKLLTNIPGFREGGFVLGNVMVGCTQKTHVWNGTHGTPEKEAIALKELETIGIGTSDKLPFRHPTCHSPSCLEFAAPLPGYFRSHMPDSPNLTPIISEMVVFNFSGQSGTGKTVTTRAAAGLFGPPISLPNGISAVVVLR